MKKIIVVLSLLLSAAVQANPVYKELRSFDCSLKVKKEHEIASVTLRDIKDIDTGKFQAVITITEHDGSIEKFASREMDDDPQFTRDIVSDADSFFGLGGFFIYINSVDEHKILMTNTNDDQVYQDQREYDFAIGHKENDRSPFGGQLTCTLNQK